MPSGHLGKGLASAARTQDAQALKELCGGQEYDSMNCPCGGHMIPTQGRSNLLAISSEVSPEGFL